MSNEIEQRVIGEIPTQVRNRCSNGTVQAPQKRREEERRKKNKKRFCSTNLRGDE